MTADREDWSPYDSRVEFETADFLFRRNQMPQAQIDTLFDIWAASTGALGGDPPFANHGDLYNTIDATKLGDAPWQSFSAGYTGELPPGDTPPWMLAKYETWFRDPRAVARIQLANPDFAMEFDSAPLQVFGDHGKRRWQNLMSGNWAWEQAVRSSYCFIQPRSSVLISLKDIISADPETHGAMFVPIVLGSDKTTVSVATGQNEYYPLYASIGNVHNNVRRAHRDALSVIGFLAIPKSESFHPSVNPVKIDYLKYSRQKISR